MCVQLGSTAIGVKATDGVVLAVEKRVTSPLLVRNVGRVSFAARQCTLSLLTGAVLVQVVHSCRRASLHARAGVSLFQGVLFLARQVPSSIEKVAEVDSHIGCAMSGLTADARTLIDHGRVEAQVLLRLPTISMFADLGARARYVMSSSPHHLRVAGRPQRRCFVRHKRGSDNGRLLQPRAFVRPERATLLTPCHASRSNTGSRTTSPCRWSRARSHFATWPCASVRTMRTEAW